MEDCDLEGLHGEGVPGKIGLSKLLGRVQTAACPVNPRKKYALKIGVPLVVVLAGGAVGAHFHLKNKVERFRAQLRAQGEKLTIQQLEPRPPGMRNGGWAVASAGRRLPPLFIGNKGEFDSMRMVAPGRARVMWRQSSLPYGDLTNSWILLNQALKEKEGALAELREGAESEAIYFPLNYGAGFDIPLPHSRVIIDGVQWLSLAVLANLHHNRPAQAWTNLHALTSLAVRYGNEPLIVSQWLSMGVRRNAIATTWEALHHRGWTEPQLSELQGFWETANVLGRGEQALSMKMVRLLDGFRLLRIDPSQLSTLVFRVSSASSFGPLNEFKEGARMFYLKFVWANWTSYRDELTSLRLLDANVRAIRLLEKQQSLGPALKLVGDAERTLFGSNEDAAEPDSIAECLLHDLREGRFVLQAAKMETARRLVVVALALERHHRVFMRYPDDLASLSPRFLRAVPIDLMDGQPLRYRLQDDGSFLLYSVGVNGRDDGGDPNPEPGKDLGDWLGTRDIVWPKPATASEVEALSSRSAFNSM